MIRTDEERDALARELGYASAKECIEKALRILNKNTYGAMQEARDLLEREAGKVSV